MRAMKNKHRANGNRTCAGIECLPYMRKRSGTSGNYEWDIKPLGSGCHKVKVIATSCTFAIHVSQ